MDPSSVALDTLETLDGAASLRTASGATEEVATAKDKKKAEDTFDPLSITNDDDIFVLILFIEEGTRFSGLSPLPYPDCSVLVSVCFEDTVESNPVPLEDRPSFREEIAFRMTKAELVESMVDKEALTLKVYLVNTRSPSTGRLLIGSQRIFADTASPVKNDPNGSIVYRLKKKKLLGGELRFADIPCLKTSLAYELWLPPEEGTSSKVTKITDKRKSMLPPDQALKDPGEEERNTERGKGGGTATVTLPALDLKEGCFILGDRQAADSLFKLTIQIIHAKDIDKALPENFTFTPGEQREFFFHFKIFQQADIQTCGFRDPANPEFVAETVDIRIASTFDKLMAFFSSSGSNSLAICLGYEGGDTERAGSNNITLAKTEIELRLEEEGIEGKLREGHAISHEGFAFFPQSGTPDHVVVVDHTERPRVGYVIKLVYLGPRKMQEEAHGESAAEEEKADEENEEEGDNIPLLPNKTAGKDAKEWTQRLEKEVLELEEWKLKQKQLFQEKLREQEKSQDTLLASEFRHREEEREISYRAKVEELSSLSEELKATVAAVNRRRSQLEQRDKALEEKESKLRKKEEELDKVQDVLTAEGKRRLAKLEQEKKEMAKKLAAAEAELEAMKVFSADATREKEKQLKRAKEEREAATKAMSREREQARKSLEDRLGEMAKSKEAYKKAWEKAEADLQVVRDEREKERGERLRASQEEVRDLREELSRMRRRGFGVPEPSPTEAGAVRPNASMDFLFPNRRHVSQIDSTASDGNTNGDDVNNDDNASRMERLAQEMRERRTRLLATGAYAHDDELVRLLDGEIKRAESKAAEGISGAAGGKTTMTTEERSASESKKRKSSEL